MSFSPDLLLYFPVLLFCLSVHECAHAWSAKMGGDLTATYAGRLTLNPIAHIDPIGTLLMPALSILFAGIPLIFWAKPVPVNPLRLRSSAWDVFVSLAGPGSNLALLLLTVLALKASVIFGGNDARELLVQVLRTDPGFSLPVVAMGIAEKMLVVNLVLMIFNLIPIPPLDGSSVVYHFFIRGNRDREIAWYNLNRFGFVILLVLINIPQFRSLFGAAITTSLEFLVRWIIA